MVPLLYPNRVCSNASPKLQAQSARIPFMLHTA